MRLVELAYRPAACLARAQTAQLQEVERAPLTSAQRREVPDQDIGDVAYKWLSEVSRLWGAAF